MAAGNSVSNPTAPLAASSNGKRLLSSSWGVCMEAMTSISPLANAGDDRLPVILGPERAA